MRERAADARILWRLLRGQPAGGTHAARLQAFYAPQAERYDAFRARLLHGREALLARLAPRPGERVVELGCGTGGSLAMLDSVVPALEGVDLVDLCPALLAVARMRAEGRANVRVHEADATIWRPDVSVDVVFMSYALTMMPQWQSVLANAHAMLVPGGRFGIVDFHLPARASRLGNAFWRRWFAHDGVHLSSAHLPALCALFDTLHVAERHAAVPYLPVLRAPYYHFIGRKR